MNLVGRLVPGRVVGADIVLEARVGGVIRTDTVVTFLGSIISGHVERRVDGAHLVFMNGVVGLIRLVSTSVGVVIGVLDRGRVARADVVRMRVGGSIVRGFVGTKVMVIVSGYTG